MNYTSLVQEKQLTILLSGEIDHHSAKSIMDAVTGKIDVYLPRSCILDFSAVTFMDSSGIAVVIHSLRAMNELEGTLQLRNVPAQPMKVLRASGIGRIVSVEERSLA